MTEKPTAQVKEHLAPIVPRFLANCKKKIETAKAALAQQDLDQVRTFGHHLKGAGGAYGFQEISQLGAAMEIAAREGDEAKVALSLTQLIAYLDNVEVTYV